MFRSYDIKKVNVTSYPELKVESFWKKIKSTPHYLEYFPDYKPSKYPPRDYLFNLLHTIDPDLVESKIMESHNSRKIMPKLAGDEYIEITSSLLQEIFDTSYRSSNYIHLNFLLESRGRAVFLMKKGAKLEFKRNKKANKDIFEEDKNNNEDRMN